MADTVILRRWKGKDGGDLIALFPEVPADTYGRAVMSYVHVGQHGAADYNHVIAETKPVLWWDQEVLDFLDELKRIGYEPDVRQRRTDAMRRACHEEAKRVRSY